MPLNQPSKKRFCLALFLLLSVLAPVVCFGLTPEERAELIAVRELLIQSRQELQQSKMKIEESQALIDSLSKLIEEQGILLERQDQELSTLKTESERQYKKLTAYWKAREIKTGAICAGSGLGVGALIVLLIFLF